VPRKGFVGLRIAGKVSERYLGVQRAGAEEPQTAATTGFDWPQMNANDADRSFAAANVKAG
jgi:hypothetical protein